MLESSSQETTVRRTGLLGALPEELPDRPGPVEPVSWSARLNCATKKLKLTAKPTQNPLFKPLF